MQNLTLTLRPHGDTPMYEQLYRHLVGEISGGGLAAGEKMPSKRALSANLSVSLNTVDTAYQMLVAEGYLEARPRSGYYVCALDALPAAAPQPSPAPEKPPAAALPQSPVLCDFSTSSVDTALFPYKTWGRIQRGILSQGAELLNHGEAQGDVALREAVARYLHEYRAVRCTPDQIIAGAGVEYLLGQMAGLLRGSVFALENPGYNRVGSILANNGARKVYVPVDEDGLRVDRLAGSGAQVVCVTPSHQFPTGAAMPMRRRAALLAWAGEKPGRYVLEDDYDSEFRFDRKPVPALQGLDREGRVVYFGTFSRSLAPSIRAAYMVLPPALLARYRAQFSAYSSTISRFEQQTIARFIDEGHFARHLARLRVAYRSRRDALVQGLTEALGAQRIEIRGAHTGLHLLLTVRGARGEAGLVASAREAGVRLTGLSRYYAACEEDCPPNTVVLGYSALREPQIRQACRLLAGAWGGEIG